MSRQIESVVSELEAVTARLGEIASEFRELAQGKADPPAPGTPLIRALEAAARLGLTTAQLYAGVRAGRIPVVRIGERQWFDPNALDAWVRKGGSR